MLALRKVWTVLVGAWAGAVLARISLDWLLGLDGRWVDVAILLAAVLGGALSVREARQVEPMDRAERRDTILGWGGVIGAVAAAACLFLPLPWGPLAALTVVALTASALARV
jgi:NhaP-type Na+/H+ or K+/H+ antiporter